MFLLTLILCPYKADAANLKLAKKTMTVAAGKSYQIKFKNEPDEDEYYVDYTYSTKSKYIKVSKSGVIKAKNYVGKKAKVKIKAVVSSANEYGEEEILKTYNFTLTVKIRARTSNDPDYDDAETFEAALNAGKNVTGKTVRFKVNGLNPNSAFGYNMYAGEHLNFCSPGNPCRKKGDTVQVKVTRVISFLGSYIIYYTNLK